MRFANDVRYGLAATVWTGDWARGHRVAQRIRSGAVGINTPFVAFPGVPFGGFKESGYGREQSIEALDLYTETKAILQCTARTPVNPLRGLGRWTSSSFARTPSPSPTPEMRRAMADAEVGDDVWGEDPTAIALQDARAPSASARRPPCSSRRARWATRRPCGRMTRPGDEVIVESKSHIVLYESGGPAALSGVMLRTIDAPSGAARPCRSSADLIEAANEHTGRPTLLWIENTHNARGGRVVTHRARPRARGDGPRRPGSRSSSMGRGSSTPRSRPARRWPTTPRRSMPCRFCFSKGLGAPVGSMVVGSAEFIDRVHRVRQLLGGGMRQVGILCAAARVAFETGVERLAEDHANARRLADGFAAALPGSVDPSAVETNMVFADVGGAATSSRS